VQDGLTNTTKDEMFILDTFVCDCLIATKCFTRKYEPIGKKGSKGLMELRQIMV
jgi:hypothetical protein